MDRENVIKELHDARRYLEDKEWSDRGASPHIDAINDAIALLKAQEAVTVHDPGAYCPKCGWMLYPEDHPHNCGNCGQVVKWECLTEKR